MKRVKLTQNKFALVDDADYLTVATISWSYWKPSKEKYTGYAIGRKHNKTVWLHRIVTGAEDGEQVDHLNGNGLDNRRSNLRVATSSLNAANRQIRSDNTSGFKGVSWKSGRTGTKNWGASIGVNGKRLYLGLFYTAKDAALAYNKAALEHFGEFARLNEI